jgi:hypothetical protein
VTPNSSSIDGVLIFTLPGTAAQALIETVTLKA